ncbi:MAG TPA: heavy metal-associated domain-containing protein [Polyangiaceae bacterium]|jgi:copper chaperone CopZ|nr:heavy metal-associated domain-containing protein [Polyangiaceae bacterium]
MSQRSVSVAIEGMSCDGCVNSVTRVLSRLPGAEVKTVTVGSATLAVDEAVPDADILTAIEKAGYRARLG